MHKANNARLNFFLSRYVSTSEVVKSFSNSSKSYEVCIFDLVYFFMLSLSTLHLLRGYLVLQLCRFGWFVNNSEKILMTSRRILGKASVDRINKATFFGHFCGGESEETMRPRIEFLRANGIGVILTYAAEADLKSEQNSNFRLVQQPRSKLANDEEKLNTSTDHDGTLFDEGEAKCDLNCQIFINCIDAVRNVSPEGFAAIKVTALGSPVILERLSVGITEGQLLFKKFDTDNSGKISQQDFKDVLADLVPSLKDSELEGFFRRFSTGNQIDYLDWTNTKNLNHVLELVQLCNNGPSATTFLTIEETVLLNNLCNRLHRVAEYATQKKVRLLIDAEQSYFQAAIDHLVLTLQHKFNRQDPIIFNTYQCYLNNSLPRVVLHLERAKCEGYWFAAKVVRGAYLVLERARAREMNYPDPIWSTVEETHVCFIFILLSILLLSSILCHRQQVQFFFLNFP
eukprot:TRINITY_DN4318_c0_g3_i1.p1 TRINITY_DN4318_c0_g3~~TRINITY_DN4318_c0_g3_i1.p1  ORF type:complete len:457 (+),score=68.21 TRINITY_DN4318_c0_g3_i1:123-1493(+)